jgi:hypothetical protein
MGRDRTNPGNALKLEHLPKIFSHTLHFGQGLFPLRDGVIVLRVNAQDHAALFFARQSLEIFLAQRFRKDFQPIEFEHAPLPVARFNERFEFALAAASSGARKLARGKSPGAIPIDTSLSLCSRRSKQSAATSASSHLFGLPLM